MADLVGQNLGKYRLVAKLGQGGMAEVYKTYQSGLDRNIKPGNLALTKKGQIVAIASEVSPRLTP